MLHLLFVIISMVNEDFEPQRVVLVLPDREPVVDNQESIGPQTVTVEKLITFPIARPMP